MTTLSKYFSAQDAQAQENWERRYLYLLDQVRGGVVLHERDISNLSSMSQDQIVAVLSAIPKCREQAMPD